MILGVIPARGGSKGVPRKNIKEICGKPLLYWSIKAAQESKLIDRFIVSTEDEEIASVARRYDAEVLMRPPELAADMSTTLELMTHIVGAIQCDTVVTLQPTSPIRHNNLIDGCIREFIESGCDNLATGEICSNYAWLERDNMPRQKLKGWFYDDGNVYIHKSELFRNKKWIGLNPKQLVIDKIYNYEIDDPIDFKIVEFLLSTTL